MTVPAPKYRWVCSDDAASVSKPERGSQARLSLKAGSALGILVLAVGIAAGWALTTILRPVEDPSAEEVFVYATVSEGVVSSAVTLPATAVWESNVGGTNSAIGVVTEVEVVDGQEVTQGTVLYTVNLRPIVVAQGAIPAFRSISLDTRGADVAQLQGMLASTGFYSGTSDGIAGAETIRGLKAWQKSMGLAPTGVAEFGDVIFVPTLPARLVLDDKVAHRGAVLSGGEDIVRVLSPAPAFTLSATESQAVLLPSGTRVQITSPEAEIWESTVVSQTPDLEAQAVTLHLQGVDDGAVCLDQCSLIPASGQTILTAKAITVEEVPGLVVPTSALLATADGGFEMVTESGLEIQVSLVASARGMSVVAGDDVEEGLRVRVPGDNGPKQ